MTVSFKPSFVRFLAYTEFLRGGGECAAAGDADRERERRGESLRCAGERERERRGERPRAGERERERRSPESTASGVMRT